MRQLPLKVIVSFLKGKILSDLVAALKGLYPNIEVESTKNK